MAVYKVPQDVEADDKLIGPFSFRQFIYLIIVALCIALAWGLAQLFLPLFFIPLPVIVFFGALALPLRKDQPMEIYLAAIVSFYMKPRQRLWDPDGVESLIEITAPKIIEAPRTKNLSQTEAQKRIGYLAQIMDTQGWAVRGAGLQQPNTAMTTDAFYAAQQVEDVLDDNSSAVLAMNNRLDQSDAKHRQEMKDLMQGRAVPSPANATPAPASIPSPAGYFTNPEPVEPVVAPEPVIEQPLEYNPYPDMNQAVIQPQDEKQKTPPAPAPSEKVVPAGIINLASNKDLSIAAIEREANRIQDKEDSNEVIVSLR